LADKGKETSAEVAAILLNPREEKAALGTPARRVGEPENVANAVKFFFNPVSVFVTGVVMWVDGGIATKLAAEDDLEAYARDYQGKE
jgi:NAD(P)-dependent dehydrogenase (short-subunit alcohol dehydrogenase family)